jgi:mannose-1-phosphate guanylyltransferase
MRERTWVILLTGDGADPHESQNYRVKNPSAEFAASPDRQALLKMTLSRARSIVPREQIAVVIDRAQKPYWGESLAMIPAEAGDLVDRGALWDSSIVAARALVLVGILRMCVPDLVDQMETAMAQGLDVRQRALTQLYARLPPVDLSRVWHKVPKRNAASSHRAPAVGRICLLDQIR